MKIKFIFEKKTFFYDIDIHKNVSFYKLFIAKQLFTDNIEKAEKLKHDIIFKINKKTILEDSKTLDQYSEIKENSEIKVSLDLNLKIPRGTQKIFKKLRQQSISFRPKEKEDQENQEEDFDNLKSSPEKLQKGDETSSENNKNQKRNFTDLTKTMIKNINENEDGQNLFIKNYQINENNNEKDSKNKKKKKSSFEITSKTKDLIYLFPDKEENFKGRFKNEFLSRIVLEKKRLKKRIKRLEKGISKAQKSNKSSEKLHQLKKNNNTLISNLKSILDNLYHQFEDRLKIKSEKLVLKKEEFKQIDKFISHKKNFIFNNLKSSKFSEVKLLIQQIKSIEDKVKLLKSKKIDYKNFNSQIKKIDNLVSSIYKATTSSLYSNSKNFSKSFRVVGKNHSLCEADFDSDWDDISFNSDESDTDEDDSLSSSEGEENNNNSKNNKNNKKNKDESDESDDDDDDDDEKVVQLKIPEVDQFYKKNKNKKNKKKNEEKKKKTISKDNKDFTENINLFQNMYHRISGENVSNVKKNEIEIPDESNLIYLINSNSIECEGFFEYFPDKYSIDCCFFIYKLYWLVHYFVSKTIKTLIEGTKKTMKKHSFLSSILKDDFDFDDDENDDDEDDEDDFETKMETMEIIETFSKKLISKNFWKVSNNQKILQKITSRTTKILFYYFKDKISPDKLYYCKQSVKRMIENLYKICSIMNLSENKYYFSFDQSYDDNNNDGDNDDNNNDRIKKNFQIFDVKKADFEKQFQNNQKLKPTLWPIDNDSCQCSDDNVDSKIATIIIPPLMKTVIKKDNNNNNDDNDDDYDNDNNGKFKTNIEEIVELPETLGFFIKSSKYYKKNYKQYFKESEISWEKHMKKWILSQIQKIR